MMLDFEGNLGVAGPWRVSKNQKQHVKNGTERGERKGIVAGPVPESCAQVDQMRGKVRQRCAQKDHRVGPQQSTNLFLSDIHPHFLLTVLTTTLGQNFKFFLLVVLLVI